MSFIRVIRRKRRKRTRVQTLMKMIRKRGRSNKISKTLNLY